MLQRWSHVHERTWYFNPRPWVREFLEVASDFALAGFLPTKSHLKIRLEDTEERIPLRSSHILSATERQLSLNKPPWFGSLSNCGFHHSALPAWSYGEDSTNRESTTDYLGGCLGWINTFNFSIFIIAKSFIREILRHRDHLWIKMLRLDFQSHLF